MPGKKKFYKPRGRGQGNGTGNKKDDEESPKPDTSKSSSKNGIPTKIEEAIFEIATVATAHQVGFTNSLKFLVSHIRLTFDHGNDIAISLEKRQHPDFDADRPRLLVSTLADDDERAAEQVLLNEELRQFGKNLAIRKSTYELNKSKTCALLWKQCTEPLKQRIENLEDYESDLKQDHVKLLQAIQIQCLVSSQEHNYDMQLAFDVIYNLITLKMDATETVTRWYERVTLTATCYTEMVGCPLILLNIIEKEFPSTPPPQANGPGFVSPDDEDVGPAGRSPGMTTMDEHDVVFDRFLAYIMIVKADAGRFGSLISTIKGSQTFKEMKYPRSTIAARDMLAQHCSSTLS